MGISGTNLLEFTFLCTEHRVHTYRRCRARLHEANNASRATAAAAAPTFVVKLCSRHRQCRELEDGLLFTHTHTHTHTHTRTHTRGIPPVTEGGTQFFLKSLAKKVLSGLGCPHFSYSCVTTKFRQE